MKNLLIIFIKYPALGEVKTRLAKSIGKPQAKIIYEHLVSDLLENTDDNHFERVLFVDPKYKISDYQNFFGKFDYRYQAGEDLGERMDKAFEYSFGLGYQNIILIGSDIPLLDSTYIKSCFNKLEQEEAIVGPTIDGGYYLIGFSKSSYTPKIFYNISWSEPTVYNETITRLKDLNVSIAKTWFDIDLQKDLLRYQTIGMKKRISELSELEIL